MDLINHYIDVLSHIQNGAAVGTIAILAEFAMRLIPTEKPKSFIYGISAVLHSVGKLSNSLGDLLDKILPQKVK